MAKVLVSGIKPTGTLHLGNYFGAIRQYLALFEEYDSYIFIADYHALTTAKNKDELKRDTFDIACAYLACGLDPNKVTLFKQSDVKEVHELTWILNTVTSMPFLMRAHAFKSQVAKNKENVKKYLDKTQISEENGNLYLPLSGNLLTGVTSFDDNIITSTHTIDISNNNDRNFNLLLNTLDYFSPEQKTLLTLVNEINEKINNGINIGLFDYPVLMASDILMYQADIVPVGQDQKQHIEYARDIAGFFNRTWGEYFKLPKEHIVAEAAGVPGTDGQKMSKSYGNAIPLFGTEEEIKKAVMGIVTDSKTPDEKKNPDENNIYNIHKLFLDEEENKELRKRYEGGGLSYKDAKEMLYEAILKHTAPMREKYRYYQEHSNEVYSILEEGGRHARAQAEETMKKVKEMVGL